MLPKENHQKYKKATELLRKINKVNKLRRCQNVVNGRDSWGNFRGNAHRSYFMSFAHFYLHHALDKNSHVEVLYDYSYVKIKSRKKFVDKENERNRPKEERARLKKRVAMRCLSREIVICCQRLSKRSCFSIGLRFY